MGVRDPRDRPVVDGGRELTGGDVGDGGDALGEADVSELGGAGDDVADGKHPWLAGLHRLEVHFDESSVHPDVHGVQPDVRRVRAPTDGHEYDIHLDRLVTERDDDGIRSDFGGLDTDADVK